MIIEILRKAGYDVLTVRDVADAGIRDNELAEISLRLERIIMTRDADFAKLPKPTLSRMRPFGNCHAQFQCKKNIYGTCYHCM